MRGQKIFSQGKGLTAAHFLIPDITRNWTSTMLTRRVQGARRALAKAIDRKERTREMDPLPMNPVLLVPLKTTHPGAADTAADGGPFVGTIGMTTGHHPDRHWFGKSRRLVFIPVFHFCGLYCCFLVLRYF